MPFDTKQEYLELIPVLAQTDITQRVQNEMSFGSVTVRFYGAYAAVLQLGEMQETLKILPPPRAIRRFMERLGIYTYDRETKRALGNWGVVATPHGQVATASYSQQLILRFDTGQQASFEVEGLSSRGLFRIEPGNRIVAIFASTGSDLVPFGLRCGLDWHWVWNAMANRIEANVRWGASNVHGRLHGHAGYIHDTLR